MSKDLAPYVALRDPDDYPSGTCVAWMEGPAKVCGKPADFYLCARHIKVAQQRQAKEAERVKERAAREAVRDADDARNARLLAKLDRVEGRLKAIDPTFPQPGRLDHGVLNTPLRQRIPSDARIHELAVLHQQRKDLRRQLGME